MVQSSVRIVHNFESLPGGDLPRTKEFKREHEYLP